MNLTRYTREEIEKEFVALILTYNESLKDTSILPQYISNKELSLMYEYSIECYKDYGIVDITKMAEKHNNINFDLYVELIGSTFIYKDWQNHISHYEESIIKSYKEDKILKLSDDLRNKKIDCETYLEKIKELDFIQGVSSNSKKSMITIEDIDFTNDEQLTYVKSNTRLLDEKVKGFALGQLSVWSGGNASAKSTYLNQLTIESINQGYKVAVYSGELVAKRLLKWVVAQCAGKRNMSYNNIENYWYVNSFAKAKILKWLNNNLYIYDNANGNRVKNIIESVKNCIKENGVKVLIIDNLMSMNLSSYGDNKYDVQSLLVQELSALAKELNVHIHFVCHPRKATTFLRKNDISGSADLTNIADNVFIMHRVNNDFKIKTKEMYKWEDNSPIYSFTNVIEVCKNRDFGVEDYMVGMYFENESKRLMDYQNEARKYKWENMTL